MGDDCKQEKRIELLEKQGDTISQTHTNVAIIVHTLLGDEGKSNGLVDKVSRVETSQDIYGKLVAIALAIGVGIGFVSSNLPAIAKFIGAIK